MFKRARMFSKSEFSVVLYREASTIFHLVLKMVYCANCGQKLEENFYFCPKCGVKTKAGTTAGVSEPWEDMKKAFATAAEQMNRAFAKAAEEARRAFKEAKKEIEWHTTSRRKIVCASCGAANPPESKFCSKCGKPLS